MWYFEEEKKALLHGTELRLSQFDAKPVALGGNVVHLKKHAQSHNSKIASSVQTPVNLKMENVV